jgi:hypothetical protein
MDLTRHVGGGPGESGEVVRCAAQNGPSTSAPSPGSLCSPLAA